MFPFSLEIETHVTISQKLMLIPGFTYTHKSTGCTDSSIFKLFKF